jgi:hypothetical protein
MLAASAQLRSSGRVGSATAQQLIDFGNRQDWQEEVLKYGRSYLETLQVYFTDFKADLKKGKEKKQNKPVAA